jgi:hypothetical protein
MHINETNTKLLGDLIESTSSSAGNGGSLQKYRVSLELAVAMDISHQTIRSEPITKIAFLTMASMRMVTVLEDACCAWKIAQNRFTRPIVLANTNTDILAHRRINEDWSR